MRSVLIAMAAAACASSPAEPRPVYIPPNEDVGPETPAKAASKTPTEPPPAPDEEPIPSVAAKYTPPPARPAEAEAAEPDYRDPQQYLSQLRLFMTQACGCPDRACGERVRNDALAWANRVDAMISGSEVRVPLRIRREIEDASKRYLVCLENVLSRE